VPDRNDNFYSEVYLESGKGWAPSFKLGPRKSALGNLPADESKFPVTVWFKNLLVEGVQQFVLNSLIIRKASPPGQVRGFKTDGSNLPWVIESLQKKNPNNFQNWIDHLQTALPDIEDIRTVERPDDKHRYLVIRYHGGLDVPSWMASDGTLRLLALTLPAYLPDFTGVYLIEEPENGIHPRAVETVFQSLSSVYNAQILLATHSPVILSMVDADKVLCFAKTPEGATDIVSGNNHPALKEWQGEMNLGVLFCWGSARMTESANNKDLVILVADRNMEYAIKGLLGRTKAFIIREVTSEIYVHPGHDSGCLLHGCDFLRPFVNQYNHALIVLDHEGCGQEEKTRIELEKNIETQLTASGWNDRAAAIVIEPELENWYGLILPM